MARDVYEQARDLLSELGGADDDVMVAQGLRRDVLLVAGLLAAAADRDDAGREAAVTDGEVGAALGLFDTMREQLDRLETEVVFEARRRSMDWRQIAAHQGLNSSQAASQRYQRLVTRLEEIRQGVR
ncbi:hypothetical protein [Streptomyces sp. NPDC056796]|uniref:hypothetical protein n=1 Tax=unclassified Streptomyces TaxID=2593676 RepID=UPI003698942E